MENESVYGDEIVRIVDRAKLFNTQLEELKKLNLELIKKSEQIVTSLTKIGNRNGSNKCTVCYTRMRKVAFVPCGHLFCESCADRARTRNRCFTCRARIENALAIFF